MSTVLIYTSPARGHLYPMMDVALALRDGGHRVVVQTLADEAPNVLAQGLEHRPISPAIEALELEDHRGGNPVSQMRITMACWAARAPHEVEDLRATTEEIAPDLLVVDANTWGAAAFAESQGRPWAMFLPYCLPVPSRDAPAFGPGFAPPKGWLGRLRDRVVWTLVGWATAGTIRAHDALRAELGVPPLGSLSALFQRADVLLYRTAEPFEYARSDWPANVHAIGPGLWAPPGEVPAWLDALPRPRVLVGVSTEHQDDGAIIEAALDALADAPGSVIVTTAALDPARFVAPHDRVRIERFLPHAQVIPEVDLVVTHGGMGTTQRALAAGVPVCVVPWGRDQNESARRVEVCGAGVQVPRGRLRPSTLASGIEAARGCRAGAEAVAQGFADAGGAARAVALLEGLLGDVQRTANAPASPSTSPTATIQSSSLRL